MKTISFLFCWTLVASAAFTAPPTSGKDKTTKAHYLKYQTLKELEPILKKVIPSRINCHYFHEHNMILIQDTTAHINTAETIIRRFDKKPLQIMIEARIVEVKLDENTKYGINWSWASQKAKRTAKVSGNFQNSKGSNEAGFTFEFGTLKIDGFTTLFDALMSNTNTDLLSNPRIVTTNGEEALISTGESVPYPAAIISGTSVFFKSEYKKIGVSLKVTATVNDPEHITLQVNPQVSEILNYKTQNVSKDVEINSPVISQREATTTVVVRDRDTCVIGGLLQNKSIQYEEKVPFLGDIPLLGMLFKKTSTQKVKSEVIIFITPTILKNNRRAFIPPKIKPPDKTK